MSAPEAQARLAEIRARQKRSTDAGGGYNIIVREDVPWLLEQLAAAHVALSKINEIRNSIVATQSLNWSEHAYPLVAALNAAGIEGLPYPEGRANIGTFLERLAQAEAKLAASEAGAAAMREALEKMTPAPGFPKCDRRCSSRGGHPEDEGLCDCGMEEVRMTAVEVRAVLAATDAGKGWTSPERTQELEAACAQMRAALETRPYAAGETAWKDWVNVRATALATDAGKGWTSPEEAEEMRASVKWLEEKCQPLLDLEDDLELAAHVACGLVFDLARGPLESECAFCRARGPNNEETIRAHLLACEKHPYSALAKEAERLRKELSDLKLRTPRMPFDVRCADALAIEVNNLIRAGKLDSRSPAADALLDYTNGEPTKLERYVSEEECARRVAEAHAREAALALDLHNTSKLVEDLREERNRRAEETERRVAEAVAKAKAAPF